MRWLPPVVVGLYHQVWGEGELFDDYDVDPGVVADRFQLGARQITLISLRQIKNRGGWIETWEANPTRHPLRSPRAITVTINSE